MGAVTDITAKEVNQAGIDLEENVKKIYKSLEKIRNLVNDSKTYFDSPAGNAIRNKFADSAAEFDKFKEFLDKYGQFLKDVNIVVTRFEDDVAEAAKNIETM